MNAKTLEKVIRFRSDIGIDVMREIIRQKIFYQFSIIRKKDRIPHYEEKLHLAKTTRSIFIAEALAAKEYWSHFKKFIFMKCDWKGRSPRTYDTANRLFDIGYHHITTTISKVFNDVGLPSELGILHEAQSKSAEPLVYDFMEWLRPVVVDQSVLVFIRKKKRKFDKITSRDIGLFINMLKKRLRKLYFHKKLGYCVTLKFWLRLNALSLLHSINHHTYPLWKFPSLRHESRCTKKPQTMSET